MHAGSCAASRISLQVLPSPMRACLGLSPDIEQCVLLQGHQTSMSAASAKDVCLRACPSGSRLLRVLRWCNGIPGALHPSCGVTRCGVADQGPPRIERRHVEPGHVSPLQFRLQSTVTPPPPQKEGNKNNEFWPDAPGGFCRHKRTGGSVGGGLLIAFAEVLGDDSVGH